MQSKRWNRLLGISLFALLAGGCRSAAHTVPSAEFSYAPNTWAVWVAIEPLNVSPTQYKCTAIVTKPTTGEVLAVPTLVVTPGEIAFTRLPVGPGGRQGQFSAYISPTQPVLKWMLFVHVGTEVIINTSARIDIRSTCGEH